MAKNVKFNLICNGTPIRTLTDLQENFSIEDVLNHYASGMLARWLEVRGYTAHLAAVQAVTAKDELTVAQNLCEIFDVEEKDLAKKVEIREYEAKLLQQQDKVGSLKQSQQGGIDEYHTNYNNLIQKIVDNKDDISIIKECVEDLSANYKALVELDFWRLFESMYNLAPLSVWVALTDELFRDKFLSFEVGMLTQNTFTNYMACDTRYIDLTHIHKSSFKNINDISKMIGFIACNIRKKIMHFSNDTDNLRKISGIKYILTRGYDYWLPVQAEVGKKLLVIHMASDCKLKCGQNVYKDDYVNDHFLLLDSFEYNGPGNRGVFYVKA